jgi:drug/metabolite transporter (DMT)-like permease
MSEESALTKRVTTRAHLSLLTVVVIWAGSFSVIKALLDDGVPASDIAILRYAIAAPGFAFILWRAKGLPGLTRGDAARVLVAGLLIVVGYHVFLNVGTRYTTSGIAALVVALAPAMTLVLAAAFGLDRIRARHVVGLAVAFVGAAIAVGLGSGNELSLASAKGPLIVLAAPLSFALYNVILKPLLGRYDLLALTAATSLVGIVGLVPLVRVSTAETVAHIAVADAALLLPGRTRDTPRIHPLERRAARHRADSCCHLYLCCLSHRGDHRCHRARRDSDLVARRRRCARGWRHRSGPGRVAARTSREARSELRA